MGKSQIDREKLRVFVRKLSGEYQLQILYRAIDLLPKTRLRPLIDGFIHPEKLRPDGTSPVHLVDAVKAFRDASLNGDYYEDFAVNSHNFTQMSRGTQTWIAECKRLLGRSVTLAGEGGHAEAREAFEMIFELLRHIDKCYDDIVFFADEAGSWQVNVIWQEVLPAWFQCLRHTAEPEEYARAVVGMVDEFVHWDRERYLQKARGAAKAEQKKALRNALAGAASDPT